ncbi:small metal-binding protein SmbP [Methylocystis rosea]|nr:small metal-binding protein SmbP [Methylocystis rosea]
MSRRLMIAMLSLGLAWSFAPRLALAQESHIAQAIHHAREAVVAGREGKPSTLVRHATEALHHAKAQQQERPNAQVKEAIARLEEGIRFGEKRRRSATRIVYRALQQLERAPQ